MSKATTPKEVADNLRTLLGDRYAVAHARRWSEGDGPCAKIYQAALQVLLAEGAPDSDALAADRAQAECHDATPGATTDSPADPAAQMGLQF